jgi:hypothetical protein
MSSHSDFQTESKRPRKDSPERKRTKGQFNAIRERWLRAVLASSLTPAAKIVATALFLHFNEKHWRTTGEMIAWPSWETLIEETATSKRSIAYAIADLEANGVLDADHGRFDPKTGKRKHNVYRAQNQVQNLHVDQVQNLHEDQVQDQVQNSTKQGAKFAQDSFEDSVDRDSFRIANAIRPADAGNRDSGKAKEANGDDSFRRNNSNAPSMCCGWMVSPTRTRP